MKKETKFFPSRRSFLGRAALASAALLLPGAPAWSRRLDRALLDASARMPADTASDEDFWAAVQAAFNAPPNLINLNNGGVSPAPRSVAEAMKRYYDFSNEAPSYNMWRVLDAGREALRGKLAALAGCSPEEVALQRNASEALETVIFGLDLKKGDEVVAARQDYPNMVSAWNQRALRDGVVVKWANLKLPSSDADYLTRAYTSLFTPATRVVHLTHMINWSGQVLPVARIASEARRQGIQVIVDGAHTFGHLPFSIPDLQCDYFGTSLHKWLYAPIGSGLLYVRKDRIGPLYPLFASDDPRKADIRKFEHLGTRPFFIEQAVGVAADFHRSLGAERKAERLHYLKSYWTDRVKGLPGVRIHTPEEREWSGALALLAIDGKTNAEIDSHLMSRYRIHTTSVNWAGLQGVRITPNVYTTLEQLDLLVTAIRQVASGK